MIEPNVLRRGAGGRAGSAALGTLGLVLALAAPVASGRGSDEPKPAMGKPAGWSMEAGQPSTLIPIGPGSALYEQPDQAGRLLATVSEGRYLLLESRHPWVKIRYGEIAGWVDLEASPRAPDTPSTDVEEAHQPERAVEPCGDWQITTDLGAYALRSEVADPELVAALRHVAEQHAELYRDRFGSSVDPSGGRIVVFSERAGYEGFLKEAGAAAAAEHGNGTFCSPRTVALVQDGARPRQLAAALAHELTHFLSWRLRRMTGSAAFPWWLEEGMAEDLALSRLDRAGRLRSGSLGRKSLRYGATLDRILIEAERRLFHGAPPGLSELMAFDHESCCIGSDAGFHLLLSALWIRFLLDSRDSELAESFQTYLGALLAGESAASLMPRLGRDEPWLEDHFRLWVQDRRQRLRRGVILPP